MATAPTLFAAQKYPEMETLIKRRFSKPGDVEKAFEMVIKSDGLQDTQALAHKYINAALENIGNLRHSESKHGLTTVLDSITNCLK